MTAITLFTDHSSIIHSK